LHQYSTRLLRWSSPQERATRDECKLNKEINDSLADATIKTRLADLGATVFVASPAEFGKFIADEAEKWGR
jgi:tripartite-type tricarboxylate transporter receptor subunit TctC